MNDSLNRKDYVNVLAEEDEAPAGVYWFAYSHTSTHTSIPKHAQFIQLLKMSQI